MAEISRQDRITACLYAGAIGDAIGAAFEGQPPAVEFSMPSDLRVTDDTQLTIATCEAIIEKKRVDPESIADIGTSAKAACDALWQAVETDCRYTQLAARNALRRIGCQENDPGGQ